MKVTGFVALFVVCSLFGFSKAGGDIDTAFFGDVRITAIEDTAEDAGGIYLHYYISVEGEPVWTSKRAEIDAQMLERIDSVSARAEEIAKLLFGQMFSDGEIGFKPDGVYVQDAVVINGELLLSVSDSIKNYGGTYFEIGLRNQIIKTALGIPGVTKVSLYIDRKLQYLTEGSIIEEETDWSELTDGLMMKRGRLVLLEAL